MVAVIRKWQERALAMQLALREMLKAVTSRTLIAAFFAVWLISFLVAPYGTDESLSVVARALYWLTITTVSFLISTLVISFVIRNPVVQRHHWLVGALPGALLIGIGIGLAIWQINLLVWPGAEDLPDLASYFWITIPISLVISLSIAFTHSNDDDEAKPAAPEVRFLRRLPKHLGQRLISVSVSDHYVEAVTDRGKHLVLMRFADALDELGEAAGMQIHRSHWVAFEAVTKPVKRSGKLHLALADGRELPVARSKLAAVREKMNL